MQDKDTANTMPGSGNSLNTTHPENMQEVMPSTRKKIEELRRPRRILVVEDDASLGNLEADVLAACGYVVTLACTGELAVLAFRESIPDLIVLDLELSGRMTGWDVLQVFRSQSRVPVLLTSSEYAVRKLIRNRGESRSTLDHLPKPYTLQALLKRIERMLVDLPS
jgi:DNA-binding response OmpR family regulator